MLLRLFFCLAVLFPAAAAAQEANLSDRPTGQPGSAAYLVLAQRAYGYALRSGDAVVLLSAIRMARSVTLRPATGWQRATPEEEASTVEEPGMDIADPAGDAALGIVRNLAGEDPDLQDLVYDLDAQLPDANEATAVEVRSHIGGGDSESWTIPLFGEVLAEIGLIGPEGVPLSLDVFDEAGHAICSSTQVDGAGLCRFTPARNGFFTVTVGNGGPNPTEYRLIGN